MDKEIEIRIQKIFAKDIEIEMLKVEINGTPISKKIVLEILKDLTK